MNIRMIIAQMFGANSAAGGSASANAAGAHTAPSTHTQTPGAGRTQLDRLMASPDRLDRIAPPPMHQVKSGETLVSIAGAYGTSWQNLARINGLGSSDAVQVGALLRLAANDAPVAAPNAAIAVGAQLPDASAAVGAPHNAAMLAQANGLTNASGMAATGLIAMPAAAQLPGAGNIAPLRSDPDSPQSDDYSLYCKVNVCPNLNADSRTHVWPCTACGRSGRADPPRLL